MVVCRLLGATDARRAVLLARVVMLSICIPVYNYDARPLVRELSRQVASVTEEIEILLYDDGSSDATRLLNAELRDLSRVRYVEAPHNIGRSAIRNLMASDASGDRLVMLDVDCWPNDAFIATYLDHADGPVVVGGTRYADEPPSDPRLFLHWHYGRRRESKAPARRNSPTFQSSNFMVRRSIMLAHPFPEVHGYGHEDTLWGQLLVPANISVRYVDNAVTHLGLEPDTEFLSKQREAIESLRKLRKAHPTLRTRLTTFVDRYPKFTALLAYLPEERLRKYVLENGSLRALDLLKLKWWMHGLLPTLNYR